MKKILIGLLLAAPIMAIGQTANPLIITWQANNYFPADYAGKALPTPNTVIVASVEMVSGGKLADITKAEIFWYANDELISHGTGVKTVSFPANAQGDGYETLRAEVKSGNSDFQGSARFQVVQPKIILALPNSGNFVIAGKQTLIQALPYFFNVDSLDNLKFFWTVNGQTTGSGGNGITLNVGTPNPGDQNSVNVSVTAQNSDNLYEVGKSVFNIPIITQ